MHATRALANGVLLTTVHDNLRPASMSTTSTYQHTDLGESLASSKATIRLIDEMNSALLHFCKQRFAT
jgi:hypothetical protein